MSDISGLILVDKSEGLTSHDVCARIRGALGVRRVGHTGTLDPGASGLLPIVVGRATKLSPFLQGLDKTYRGTMRFGVVTDSLDADGTVVEERDAGALTREQAEAAVSKFRGWSEQVPPMFSAIHSGGTRLYELARQGVTVERTPRRIRVYSFDVEEFVPGRHPCLTFRVCCSAGTYIRSLCRDIGVATGVGAHQAALRRLGIGPFSVDDARSLEEVEQTQERGRLKELVRTPLDALPHLTLLQVKADAERLVGWGQPLYPAQVESIPAELEKGDRVRLGSEDGRLLAVAMALQTGTHVDRSRPGFKYLRVFA